jgi:hypothetical protein
MSNQPDSILGFITGPSMSPRGKNEIGNRYERLLVIARLPGKGRARWLCLCDCGNTAEVYGTNLRQGMQRSCGCLRVESAQRFHPRADVDHPRWKGEGASYAAKHGWVKRHKQKTGSCAYCSAMRLTDWANISGQYLRDLNDYIELCKRCHYRLDRKGNIAAA